MTSRRRKIIGGRYSVQTPAIGSGSFAKVYKATDIQSGKIVAIKVINRKKINHNRKLVENLEKEIMIMKRLDHENIIQLLDVISDADRIRLVLEFCEGKDLSDLMQKHGPFSEKIAQNFLRQLAAGLACIRKENFVHRDLKPQNLLLSSSDLHETVLKIADFGFARPMEQESMIATLCGSPLYMAPEILREELYGVKADLWSVGVILYEMLCGDVPFPAVNTRELKRRIEKTRHSIPDNIQLSAECRNLLDGLLQKDPQKRMTFTKFFNHPFVKDPNEDFEDFEFDFEFLDFDEMEIKEDEPAHVIPQNISLKNMRFLGTQERQELVVMEVRKAVAIVAVAESNLVSKDDGSGLMFGMDGVEEYASNVLRLKMFTVAIKLLKAIIKASRDLVSRDSLTIALKRLDEFIQRGTNLAEIVSIDAKNFEDPQIDCMERIIYEAAMKNASSAAIEETMGDMNMAMKKYKDAIVLLLFLLQKDGISDHDNSVVSEYLGKVSKRCAVLEGR